MSHKFRYGDKVIANGQEAIVQVVRGGIIRLDIDGGVRMWHPEDLELVHSDMRKLNIGDEVIVQEPTKLQKKYYPGGWNESHIATVTKETLDSIGGGNRSFLTFCFFNLALDFTKTL